MECQQRFQIMHKGVLAPWRHGIDIALEEAAIGMRPMGFNPIGQCPGSGEMPGTVIRPSGRAGERKDHKGGIIEIAP